jgi:hypothetical protein
MVAINRMSCQVLPASGFTSGRAEPEKVKVMFETAKKMAEWRALMTETTFLEGARAHDRIGVEHLTRANPSRS